MPRRLLPQLQPWGVALAKHGDLNAAAATFQLANQKGLHWADPLKAWGDVHAKQGRTDEALAKYDEALRYPPNWKQLQEARDISEAEILITVPGTRHRSCRQRLANDQASIDTLNAGLSPKS
jgi:tetratricopeptide (TPR) repeat protein